jgi:hypothetical protein
LGLVNVLFQHVTIASLKIIEASYRVKQGYRTLVKEERENAHAD